MQQADVHKKVRSNVDLTYAIRNYLLRGRLFNFGQALNEAWQLKREFSCRISNSFLDQIYEGALQHGAIGGKLLGAGGGGFFLFYASPFQRHQLVEWLESEGLIIHPFRFDPEGLTAWTARESKHHQESNNL
jgi:D-glycero-alpha-D-manno-heptose-7-phosphate kinase